MVRVSRERRGCGDDFERLVMLMIKRGGDLSGEVLCGYDLSGLRFEGVKMRGVRLLGVDLSGVEFVRCDLRESVILCSVSDWRFFEFEGCKMGGSVLSVDGLEGVFRFKNCDLSGSVFVSSEVVSGSFEGSCCEGVDFRGMVFDVDEAEGLFMNGYIREPRLVFDRGDMRGARFDGMSLGHSSFEYVDLEGASFRGCDLSVRYELDSVSDSKGDFFYGGEFYSEGTSMVGALLSGVDWEGANVEGVIYN